MQSDGCYTTNVLNNVPQSILWVTLRLMPKILCCTNAPHYIPNITHSDLRVPFIQDLISYRLQEVSLLPFRSAQPAH